MALVRRSKTQDVLAKSGNGLAIYVKADDNEVWIKDQYGQEQLLSDYISGGGGGGSNNSPYEFNITESSLDRNSIQPVCGSNITYGVRSNIGGGQNNSNYGDCSSIQSGRFNSISDFGDYNMLGSGYQNRICGISSFIGAGQQNHIYSGLWGGIVAGENNSIFASADAFIGGGKCNVVCGKSSSVLSGECNLATGGKSAIGSGIFNIMYGGYGFIGAGQSNCNFASDSIIGAGRCNLVCGSRNIIGSGYYNKISCSASYSAILSGQRNCVQQTIHSSILGGGRNIICGGSYNTITGGERNCIQNYSAFGYDYHNTIVGGIYNKITGTYNVGNTVLGGRDNDAINYNYWNILSGCGNCINYAQASLVTGKNNQLCRTTYGTVAGRTNGASCSYGFSLMGNRVTVCSSQYVTNFGNFNDIFSSYFSSIGNGVLNKILDGRYNTIQNGRANIVCGTCHLTVVSGCNNVICGGQFNFIGHGCGNYLRTNSATIVNAYNSCVVGNTSSALIGSGKNNRILGGVYQTIANGCNATICGGLGNFIGYGFNSGISGYTNFMGVGLGGSLGTGYNDGNFVGFQAGTILYNGFRNAIVSSGVMTMCDVRNNFVGYTGNGGTICNACNNTIGTPNNINIYNSNCSVMLGGIQPELVNTRFSFIGTGRDNCIVGGFYNTALTGCGINIICGNFNSVFAGKNNLICGTAHNTITSGYNNTICGNGCNVIINGTGNFINDGTGYGYSYGNIIGNGKSNLIYGGSYGAIVNGECNRVNAYGGFIGAGRCNCITYGVWNTILSGYRNKMGVPSGQSALQENLILNGNTNLICGGQTQLNVMSGCLNKMYGYSRGNIIQGRCHIICGADFSGAFGSQNTICGVCNAFALGCGINNSCANSLMGYQLRANNLCGGAVNICVNASGTIVRDTSDIRLKTEIKPIPTGLHYANLLNPVSFYWNQKGESRGKEKQFGFIAQEIQKEFPFLVSQGNDGYLALSKDKLTAISISAIKELTQCICGLCTYINNMKKR